jgi:hypothetical protein
MISKQKRVILTVVLFILSSALAMLGLHVYNLHLRRVAENGPGAVSEVQVVHRSDGASALLTVAHIKVRQYWGRGLSRLVLHRLEVIDAASGRRLLRRSWDDDAAWPRCRDAGHGRLRCQSPKQPHHLRSLATLDEIEAVDGTGGEAASETPARGSGPGCTTKRAGSGGVVFETRRAKTSIREVLSVRETRLGEARICTEPELIAPEIVCDEATGETPSIGIEKAVVVDHKSSLIEGADNRHALTAIDSECRVRWELELAVAGRVAFASVVKETLVVLAAQSSHGVYESHLLGIAPATGTLRWQL